MLWNTWITIPTETNFSISAKLLYDYHGSISTKYKPTIWFHSNHKKWDISDHVFIFRNRKKNYNELSSLNRKNFVNVTSLTSLSPLSPLTSLSHLWLIHCMPTKINKKTYDSKSQITFNEENSNYKTLAINNFIYSNARVKTSPEHKKYEQIQHEIQFVYLTKRLHFITKSSHPCFNTFLQFLTRKWFFVLPNVLQTN